LLHFPEGNGRERDIGERFAQLEAATRNRKRVSLHYRTASTGYTRRREVDPYGVVYRAGKWLLVGYGHSRRGVRSLRLDRLGEVSVAPKPKSPGFERPRAVDARAFATRSPWTFRQAEVEVGELTIRPEAARVANDDFGPDAERVENDDG